MKPKVLYVAGISGFLLPKNGGQIRTHNILKQLCTQFEVDIFSPYLPSKLEGNGIRIANNICPESLKRMLRLGSQRGFSRLIDGHLRRKAANSRHHLRNAQFYERLVLENLIQSNHSQYQHIFFDTSRYAPLSPTKQIRVKSWLIAHNVDSVLDPNSTFHARIETNLKTLFRGVITCTEDDSLRLQSSSPGIMCIEWPNGTDLPQCPTAQEKIYDLLFVGSLDYKPNIEAVTFIRQILWPVLKRQDSSICVAGRGPSDQLKNQLREDGIILIANAENLSDVYAKSQIAIIPLFSGSGSRLKIAEALIHGLPVVSSHTGAEGYPTFQEGLYRTECTPITDFIKTINLARIENTPEKQLNIAQKASKFLWSSTIDLAKLNTL